MSFERRSLVVFLTLVLVLTASVLAIAPASAADWYTWSCNQGLTGDHLTMYGIYAVSPTCVWAVGANGGRYLFDGTTWRLHVEQPLLTSENLLAIDGYDGSHIWAVGDQGTILFFDGTTWSISQKGNGQIHNTVEAYGPDQVWIGTNDSGLLRQVGTGWASYQIPRPDQYSPTPSVRSIYEADPQHIWVSTGSGMYFSEDHNTFTRLSTPPPNPYGPIAGSDANHVWVHQGSKLWFFDGRTWSIPPFVDYLSGFDCTGIAALDEFHVWAVGRAVANHYSNVVFWNGFCWKEQGVMTSQTLDFAGIAAPDRTSVIALATSNGWIAYGKPSSPPEPTPTSRAWGHDSVGVPEISTAWYLAEGCTGGSFETWVLVQNPYEAKSARVSLTYMTSKGAVGGPSITLPPSSRASFNVADTVPGDYNVSTKVTSNIGVVAERSIYAGNRKIGTNSAGITTPQDLWYLAEGCTRGGFETWVLVQNPNDSAATVNLRYMTPTGVASGPKASIPANSRATFFVADSVPDQWSVSTEITSNKPVVAERSMYWNNRIEGHDSVGTNEPAKTWYLAEGSTNGGMETWILVQNPNTAAAKVTLTYMTPDGQVAGPVVSLPANARQTFFVADTVPSQWSVSTKVTSDKPVIAERAMYGNNRSWGTDSIGVAAAAQTWYLAEGCTGAGFESWVLVQNPNGSNAQVTLTYMTPEGAVPGPSETLAPYSRKTYNIASTVWGASQISTRVTSDKPVIAERSMYGD
ncbi:MAG: DUF5719 family protein [Candidatus Geothermincolia bacterium]